MIAALDLTDKESKTGADRARGVCQRALKKGILIRPLGATIYLMPPLITDNEVVAQTVRVLLETVAEG
jgi:adenosylmethionine-8-amino-7-oxononanoate aminotransferase